MRQKILKVLGLVLLKARIYYIPIIENKNKKLRIKSNVCIFQSIGNLKTEEQKTKKKSGGI